jgi:porphobilinogen synthase
MKKMQKNPLPLRLSRLRSSPQSRALVRETQLHPENFIAPIFISEKVSERKAIASMPGQYQLPLDDIAAEIASISDLGIPAVILFGVPKQKDACGSQAFADNGIIQQAIRKIRESNQDILIIADVCFCEYTDHGHCGLLHNATIDTDKTLTLLGQQAVSLAKAGANWIAPSGMTDGMVAAIRQALDEANFTQIPILSYSVKYSSCLYNPFREAAEGAPQFGDRKAYQMDPANGREALREVALDIQEGADMLMVKPALYYLDIIYRIKQQYPEVPLCAFQVSGEYAMIKAAAAQGMINEEQAMLESLTAIKRAGADFIISYFAKAIAQRLTLR